MLKKTILLLNKLGYKVLIPAHSESARAYISKGFLEEAKTIATENVSTFSALISNDIPLVGIEPSAILGFRDEYPNLVDATLKSNAENLAQNVFTIEEFLANEMNANKIDVSNYKNRSVIIKGCSKKNIPENSYIQLIQKIQPVVKSIMYGEACSSVPLFKKKNIPNNSNL